MKKLIKQQMKSGRNFLFLALLLLILYLPVAFLEIFKNTSSFDEIFMEVISFLFLFVIVLVLYGYLYNKDFLNNKKWRVIFYLGLSTLFFYTVLFILNIAYDISCLEDLFNIFVYGSVLQVIYKHSFLDKK